MNITRNEPLIHKTQAMCPKCLNFIAGEIREDNGSIWLVRSCPSHGETRTLLSTHPDYFRDLHGFYTAVMDRRYPQRDFILRLTERCNLECPICLAGANQQVLADFSIEEIKRMVKGMRGKKIDLMGCEPTIVKDLPEIIRIISDSGNISALHSNGVELADFDYLKKLKENGLHEVHLQFDGFDDKAYEIIRGKPLLQNKLQAFGNLEKLGIPVDLVMTILAGVNEKEIGAVLDFAVQHSNVKEVFFLGCRMLGRAAGHFESAQLLPDQVIDLVAASSKDRISRERVRRFQKLYFGALSIFRVRKCLYIQHYLLMRKGEKEYVTLDDVVNMPRLERVLERYRRRREEKSALAVPLFFLESFPTVVNFRTIGLLADFFVLTMLMKFGFNLMRVRSRTIMLGYITACDPLIYNTFVAENCGKGEISRDLGVQEAGALANVMREHRWRQK